MISPDSSATGMNSAGSMAGPPRRCQRSSASCPTARAVGERHHRLEDELELAPLERALEVGLGLARGRRRAGAGPRRRSPRRRCRAPWPGRPRRRRGRSARRGRCRRSCRTRSRCWPRAGSRRARPAPAPRPPRRQPSASAVRSSTSSQTTTNSSPPSRATVSAGRTAAAIRPAERDQQRVAGGMAEEVVDALEVVEVDEQHRGGAAGPLGQRERVLDAVAAERAVGEPGQRVVERLVADAVLEQQARERDREHVGDRLQEQRPPPRRRRPRAWPRRRARRGPRRRCGSAR